MTLDKDKKILIVGLGLIGGSYAAALSQNGWEVGAIDPDPQAIAFAEKAGFIRHGRTEPEAEYVGKFDIVVFALYPHVLLEWLEKYGPWLRDGALATDVTGVKSGVVEKAQSLLFPRVEFIGAHPMAGREVSGVENARADLFRGANYIVTPTSANTEEAITCCEALGRTLGARNISRLTPKEHDEMIGFLSQLTHCIAVALMTCNDDQHLEEYTGDSFRDLTRIARINDEMWSELFLLNRDALLSQMDAFEAQLGRLRETIASGKRDEMRAMMRRSAERRAKFDKITK